MSKPSLTDIALCIVALFALRGNAVFGRTDTIVLSGQEGPGVPGSQVKSDSLGVPVLADDGYVALGGNLVQGYGGVTANNDACLWYGLPGQMQLAREGDPLPGSSELFWGAGMYTQIIVQPGGQIALQSWMIGTIDNLAWVAKVGQEAPGTGGAAFYSTINTRLNRNGQYLIRGLAPQYYGGLWIGSGGSLDLVIRRGDAAPGLPGHVLDGATPAVINDNGEIAFPGFASGDFTYWAGTPGNIQVVLHDDDPAPGMPGKFVTHPTYNYSDITINNGGAVAIMGEVTGTKKVIWVGMPGALQVVAYENQPAPGVPGATFGGILDPEPTPNGPDADDSSPFGGGVPAFNDQGQIVFRSSLAGVPTDRDEGLWAGTAGNVRLVVREGDAAPGGGVFTRMSTPQLNNTGQILFRGTRGSSGTGLYIVDQTGEMVRVAAPGDQLEGQTVYSVTADSLVRGNVSDGKGRNFNDFGQVAYQAALTSSANTGAFLYTPALHWRSATSGNWSNTLNWTLSLTPARVHDVTIDPATALTVTGPAGDTTLKSLVLGSGAGHAELNLQSGVELTVADGVTVASNGTLSGNGTIAGNVTNNGEVRVGSSIGAISIDGDYSNNGTLRMQLQSPTQYDQLSIAGTAFLGGTLEVSLLEGATPTPGNYDLLNFASSSSSFAEITLPLLTGAYRWDTSSLSAEGILRLLAMLLGDVNLDGAVNALDISPFVSRLTQGIFQAEADINRDGLLNALDISGFVACLTSGSCSGTAGSAVPEPSSLCALAAACLLLKRRRH